MPTIYDQDQLDPIPVKDPHYARSAQLRAIAVLIRMDALDLLPVLFAPVRVTAPKGLRR